MNKKNYGTIPYYDFLPNQRQVCIILILSVSSIFFITSRISKATEHQKNSNLNAGQTNNTSSLQYILADCRSHTPVKACGINALLTADLTNPGKLDFSIKGTPLNAPILLSATASWSNFTVRWTSGASTTADIGILNENLIPDCNDFALDDIVFAPVCRNSIVVNLYQNPSKPSITRL